jgi:hypothetical protein
MAKGKFDISAITNAKWIGYAAAAIAAISAFASSMAERKQEKTIEELVDRVSKLENK